MKRKIFFSAMLLSFTLGTMSVTWVGASADERAPEPFSDGAVFAAEVQTEPEQEPFSDGGVSQEEPSVGDGEIKELEDGKIEFNGVFYQYEPETDSYTILGGTGQKTIELQENINGKKVTKIADRAFYHDTVLEEFEIKQEIELETIGESAFEGCTNLTEMLSAKFIGKNAYYGCENLTYVGFSNGDFVSSGAFWNCPRLCIAYYAHIQGDFDAFDPDNKILVVSESGGNPFEEFNIRYDTGAEYETIEIDEIGYATYLRGFLIDCREDASGNIYVENEAARAGEIKTIGRNAFYSCEGITSIHLPNTVTTIETKAFNKCEGLTRVEIPSSVTTIADDALLDCPKAVIYTTEGSYAEQFSKTHGIPCMTEKNLEAPKAPVYKKVTGNVAEAAWKKVKGAEGYQVIIGRKDCDKKGNYWQIRDTKNLSAKFAHVRHGTFYSYVRAYKKEDGKKIYSEWSDGTPVYVQAFTPSTPDIDEITVSGSTVTVWLSCSRDWAGYDVVLGKSKNAVQPTNYAYIAKNNKSGRVVFKNVKKGTYYIGAHTFNRTGTTSAKVFSQWSKVRKITVK